MTSTKSLSDFIIITDNGKAIALKPDAIIQKLCRPCQKFSAKYATANRHQEANGGIEEMIHNNIINTPPCQGFSNDNRRQENGGGGGDEHVIHTSSTLTPCQGYTTSNRRQENGGGSFIYIISPPCELFSKTFKNQDDIETGIPIVIKNKNEEEESKSQKLMLSNKAIVGGTTLLIFLVTFIIIFFWTMMSCGDGGDANTLEEEMSSVHTEELLTFGFTEKS